MSVYTVLSAEQINQFAQGYGKTVQRITPIQQGIENSNWFVDMVDGQRAVLTVFEELDLAGATGLAGLLDGIAAQGLPVAAPWRNQAGQRLSILADKPAQLAPCLQGQHPMQPTPAQCAAMGEGLARLHMAMQSVAFDKTNAHGQTWWQYTASTLTPSMNADDQTLLEGLFTQFAATQTQIGAQVGALPRGLIHGDLFRDNSLFDGDGLTGILDFSECCVDDYLLDIAITLNDFCSAWPSVQLDQAKKTAFIAGYEQVRAFTTDEQNALPVYLAMAAGRFWLSRLQVAERNASEGRVSEHVLQKDPNEMREMVRDRLNQAFVSDLL
jgi:homoserine kinase type II